MLLAKLARMRGEIAVLCLSVYCRIRELTMQQVSSLRTQGPITTGPHGCVKVLEQHLSTRASRRMGPRVRGDDVESKASYVRLWPISRLQRLQHRFRDIRGAVA